MRRKYRAPMWRVVVLEGRPLFQINQYEADEDEEIFSNSRDGGGDDEFWQAEEGDVVWR